jgi:hypothetical protein
MRKQQIKVKTTLGLEGESTNENWTISLENQGKFIMV